MSNASFFWKVMEDIRSFKAFVAWIKRGFKRKPKYKPKTEWIKEILRRKSE